MNFSFKMKIKPRYCIPLAMIWLIFLIIMLNAYISHSDECSECTCTKRKAHAAAKFRAGNGFVYFHHIHKAGGSTLCSILARSKNIRLGAHVNCNLQYEMIPRNKSSIVQMRSLPASWVRHIVHFPPACRTVIHFYLISLSQLLYRLSWTLRHI